MRRRRRKSLNIFIQKTPDNEVAPLIRLWVLRVLIMFEGHKAFVESREFESNSLAIFLGLGHWVKAKKFDSVAIRQELELMHSDAEEAGSKFKPPKVLSSNITKLSKIVGLNKTEQAIIEFTTILKMEPILSTTVDYIGDYLSTAKVSSVLSVILNIQERKIQKALNFKNPLFDSGLLRLDRRGADGLNGKLDLISNEFPEIVYSNKINPIDILSNRIIGGPEPELKLSDYKHLTKETNFAIPFLKEAIKTKRKGVNILIYGVPGTGKTQLARVLAKILKSELFEVSSEDEDGEAVRGSERLRNFKMAQNILAKKECILLFDEVETIFSDSIFVQSTASKHKAWVNRILEENPVPTIWITNSPDIDNAFIRRFDMVVEMGVPPKKQREKIIIKSCADFLSKQAISRIAESEKLSPAVVNRAASVVKSVGSELFEGEPADVFEFLINNTLELQGHKAIKKNDPNRLPSLYNPKYINASTDISKIVEGLKKSKSGRICIYGPPGTGKTAYGRWVAQQLELPLIIKRASDLLSKYIGETEKNIAAAFNEAETEGALLMIDEVDSFLQDRRGAKRSWEVSQVNEMLTQIESFSGVFMASTNLVNNLDQAALRRFDLKVKFDFLAPKQAWSLFKQYCGFLHLTVPKSSHQKQLQQLVNITPGDFAAIVRRSKFIPVTSVEQLLTILNDEAMLKQGGKVKPIGFIK